jgi:DNA-binding NarL/FixJ family response regulator
MNQSGGDMSSNYSLSIVLIDDSNIVLAQLEAMIAEIDGVEVVATANDDAGAIRVVREHRSGLAIMDIVMPGPDRPSGLLVINAKFPETGEVMFSSFACAPTKAQEAFRPGAVQEISKAFDAGAHR